MDAFSDDEMSDDELTSTSSSAANVCTPNSSLRRVMDELIYQYPDHARKIIRYISRDFAGMHVKDLVGEPRAIYNELVLPETRKYGFLRCEAAFDARWILAGLGARKVSVADSEKILDLTEKVLRFIRGRGEPSSSVMELAHKVCGKDKNRWELLIELVESYQQYNEYLYGFVQGLRLAHQLPRHP